MVATTTKTKIATSPAFPVRDIEACIRDYLEHESNIQSALHGSAASDGGGVGPQPVIDSLVVVAVLCELETKVPFELPDSLVRAGGYDSVDSAVGHLMPQLKEKWQKHHQEKR